MAYRGSAKQNEIAQLQYELMNEVKRDVPEIAKQVFGDTGTMPDVRKISNQQLDQVYREAYARNDREFLQNEALRDPQQFLDVTDRIGVPDPPMGADGKPTGAAPNALQGALAAPQPPVAALPPMVQPAAPVLPVALPVQPPTVVVPQAVQPPLPGMA